MTGSLVANPPVNSVSDFFAITRVGAAANGAFSASFGEVLTGVSSTTDTVAGAAIGSTVSKSFIERAEGFGAGAAVVVSFSSCTSSLTVADGATTASVLTTSSSALLFFYYMLFLLSEPTRPFAFMTSNTLL